MAPSPYCISVVVPVFNESACIRAFHERTTKALESLAGASWALVYVDDGSTDDSFARLADFAAAEPRVRVVKLSRNFGHQVAITAGLDRARGDCVVVIDSDLQDPPEVIAGMVEKWREGFDVVYGVRSMRKGESAFKRFTAAVFYRLLDRIAGIRIPVDAGDFRLMSRRAVDELSRLREQDRFVRGLVSWVGFPQTGIPYERDERFAGKTRFPHRRRVAFAVDSITGFSAVPLALATWLGFATTFLSLLQLAMVCVREVTGRPVRGWEVVLGALLLVGGIQLLCLGILGAYLGRMSHAIKGRPIYVVETVLGGCVEDSVARR